MVRPRMDDEIIVEIAVLRDRAFGTVSRKRGSLRSLDCDAFDAIGVAGVASLFPGDEIMTTPRAPRIPNQFGSQLQPQVTTAAGVSATHASRAYRELVHALADSVVEYHAMRHGVDMVSHVNYSLSQRVQRQRAVSAAPSSRRR